METLWQWVLAYIIYFIIVWFSKRIIFLITDKDNATENESESIHVFKSTYCPDFYSSKHYKHRIEMNKKTDNEDNKKNLSTFIKNVNHFNLLLSIILTSIVFVLPQITKCEELIDFSIKLAILRFLSRSFEITYAFLKDTVKGCTTKKSELDKYDRIKLAMKSYFEIYIYSAGAYMFLCSNKIFDSISMSLNVGSLTNVGMAFPAGYEHVRLFVFVQIFATMNLVILSLASYLSSPEKENSKRLRLCIESCHQDEINKQKKE